MVCILLALPNITFFLMFSAHKPLQSTSWVSDHLMMSPDGVCAYVCFCCLSSQWGFHSLAPKQFLGFLWFCLLLSNLNPWNSLTGATVPGIKPQVLWCVSVIYFCNSVLSGFPNMWFWCISVSPDRVSRSVVLIISMINFTFKFFLGDSVCRGLSWQKPVSLHQTSSFEMFCAHCKLLQSVSGFGSSDCWCSSLSAGCVYNSEVLFSSPWWFGHLRCTNVFLDGILVVLFTPVQSKYLENLLKWSHSTASVSTKIKFSDVSSSWSSAIYFWVSD